MFSQQMKIFNWMRNKLNVKKSIEKSNKESTSQHQNQPCEEEFFDWPNALLSIGTFGNSDPTILENNNVEGNLPPKQVPAENTTKEEFAESGICLEKKSSDLSKKSLSFLLKKALLCSSGFEPKPMLRDPFPLPSRKLDRLRMEKILRAMLHKKIYPQKGNPQADSKKYLDMPETDSDDEEYDESRDKSRWVNTDSEYIVLEI